MTMPNKPIYIIITASRTTDLMQNVNEMLNNDYMLHGNTFFADSKFCQVMILKNNSVQSVARL